MGDEKVRSATKGTENYFAVPEGAIVPEDRVIVFDDVGFTGKTRKAMIQLVEKIGAKVSSTVNVIEKSYDEQRVTTGSARSILGISGFHPEAGEVCSITVTELFLEKLESPKTIHGVRYEPGRSLSSVRPPQ